jgi:single-strand DNA-binding protein
MSVNVVIISGRLTANPELRYTPSGTALCTFGLAVNERGKDGETASFFDCVVFDKQAEAVAQHLGKGALVTLEGTLQQRRWETDDGQKRSKVEIRCRAVHFGPKGAQDVTHAA